MKPLKVILRTAPIIKNRNVSILSPFAKQSPYFSDKFTSRLIDSVCGAHDRKKTPIWESFAIIREYRLRRCLTRLFVALKTNSQRRTVVCGRLY